MSDTLKSNNSREEQVNSIVEYVSSLVPLSEFEKSNVARAYRLVSEAIPSTKLLLGSKISEVLECKTNLMYIKQRLLDEKRKIYIPHINKYNKLFTILTRQGRPSTESKITEIYAMNVDLQNSRDKLSDIDNLLEFLESYISILDTMVKNLDGRKYDL